MDVKDKLRLELGVGIVCVIVGITLVPLFLIRQQNLPQDYEELQTTAVIVEKEIEVHTISQPKSPPRTEHDYWIYLDFSDSQIDEALAALLQERKQGIELSDSDEFNQFWAGERVNIVYYTLESQQEKVYVKFVDDCQALGGSGNLRSHVERLSDPLIFVAVGGTLFVIGVIVLIGYFIEKKRARTASYTTYIAPPPYQNYR